MRTHKPQQPLSLCKKTKGFIKDGIVDVTTLQFKEKVASEINQIVADNNGQLDHLIENKYLSFFKQQPYEKREISQELISSMVVDEEIKKMFRLN